MALRMVFDRQDLQSVRLVASPDPMWELVLGLMKTRVPSVPAPLVPWRQEIDRRLAGSERGSRALPMLHRLLSKGDFPDFLTPPELVTDIAAGCEAVACTPRARLTADLDAVFAGEPPPWARSLADGDRQQVGQAVRALHTAHDLLVAPYWTAVREVVAADRGVRANQASTDGIGALLSNLPGVLSWDGQVLSTLYPEERTVHLSGRGLVLLPSYFCWGNPVTWMNPELPPVLVYQAGGHRGRLQGVTVSKRLVSLIGPTRAECLRLLLAPQTTTELAHQLGTSVGTASKQAAVLRDTGLIRSSRCGTAVLHSITSLGLVLLVGNQFE